MDVSLVIFVIFSLSGIHAQSSSIECSKLLTDTTLEPELGRWSSSLEITPDDTLHGIILDIIFTKNIKGIGSSLGVFTTNDNIKFHIEHSMVNLYAYTKNKIKFYVNYNTNEAVPAIRIIKLNGIKICKTPLVSTRALIVSDESSDSVGTTYSVGNVGRTTERINTRNYQLQGRRSSRTDSVTYSDNKNSGSLQPLRTTSTIYSDSNNPEYIQPSQSYPTVYSENYNSRLQPSRINPTIYSDSNNPEYIQPSQSYPTVYSENYNSRLQPSRINPTIYSDNHNSGSRQLSRTNPSIYFENDNSGSLQPSGTNPTIYSENHNSGFGQPSRTNPSTYSENNSGSQQPSRTNLLIYSNNNNSRSDRTLRADSETFSNNNNFELPRPSRADSVTDSNRNYIPERPTRTDPVTYSNNNNSGSYRPRPGSEASSEPKYNEYDISREQKPRQNGRQPATRNQQSYTTTTRRYSNEYDDEIESSSRTVNRDYFEGDAHIASGSKINRRPVPNRGSSDNECGKVAVHATPLIVGGDPTSEGDWPWHGAVFQSQTAAFSKYICGGTLVSLLHLVTAAHCVTLQQTTTASDHRTFTIYLGRYNLRILSENTQTKRVKRILVHPNYNYTNYYADLAILKFDRPARYTNYVRPICLWKDTDTELENIIERDGTVVGWGFDNDGVVQEELSLVRMPVVKHTTCIWSYREFFSAYTSDKSFCAGYKNGTSVCNGDSGGGMVFADSNDYDSPTWRLRGVVSLSVARQEELKCDTNHYAIFTDTAKFLSWIKNKINSQ